MSGEWSYVLHRNADEFISCLHIEDRRSVRAALTHLTKHPFQRADAELRPRNDRIYSIKNAGRIRVIYWLDLLVREVVIVRIERW